MSEHSTHYGQVERTLKGVQHPNNYRDIEKLKELARGSISNRLHDLKMHDLHMSPDTQLLQLIEACWTLIANHQK